MMGAWLRFLTLRRCIIVCPTLVILGILSLNLVTYILRELEKVEDVRKWQLESAESFLVRYANYCEENFQHIDEREVILKQAVRNINTTDHTVALRSCECIPKTIIGGFGIEDLANISITWDRSKPQYQREPVLAGGRWEPKLCVARQKVAIIIPYRDRAPHLQRLLSVLHPLLQRQQLNYRVFVAEQMSPMVFNKATLMNAAFREASHAELFDCYVFHDVDMLPEDDRNFYTCWSSPRHLGAFLDKFDYQLLYFNIFGGATSFTQHQFEKVNGFSNKFYGWGGEDDDMFMRVSWHGMHIERYPRSVARYRMIKHEADSRNPYNTKANMGTRYLSEDHYKNDGLSNLNYSVQATVHLPLYTWIKIDLPEPPVEYQTFDRNSKHFINMCSIGLLLISILVVVALHHRLTAKESNVLHHRLTSRESNLSDIKR